MSVRDACKPRPEVLKGDLDDAIFAADFGHLIAGKAPKVYSDPKTFFRNTHPAQQLCKVVQAVFQRLTTKKEGGAAVRLSTGFGGGKTHTLMAMWHLANNIGDASLGTELLPAAGRPPSVKVAAVDASAAGTPVFARHGKRQVHSLWAELAWQLGDEKGLKAFAAVDDAERQPDDTLIDRMFPAGPVLILLDELVIYMSTLSERGQNNLLAFLGKLISAVGKRPQTVLVITDPARQLAYAQQSAQLAQKLQATAARFDDILGRKMTDFDPIGKEAAKVIARRLFDSIDPAAAQAASAEYNRLYQRVLQESPGRLPASAGSADYAERIVECYPFHPRLLDTAQDRLGALPEFNKSRGTLRLFARILRDVWEGGADLSLITAGDIRWSSPRIQADLLSRLNRDNFQAAVNADIERHAAELDSGRPDGIHRRVASALLLESLPLQPNSGLDPQELTLAVLRPEEAGPEPAEALDRLVGVCWHTYPMPGGRGWQFRYEPNVNRLIEERAAQVSIEDARSHVLAEAQKYFKGPAFKLAPWPTSARQVPDIADLQLALCETEDIARSVCANADDTNPSAPEPRRFLNAIVAVTASPEALSDAVERARRLIAADEIEREYRGGDQFKLMREQLVRLKPEIEKRFRIQTSRAFNRVCLPGGSGLELEEKYQVDEKEVLRSAHGQQCLRRFLDDQGFIYQSGSSLDPGRFLRDILPGATPLAGQPDVYTAKAIHERFLSAPNLCLLPDGSVVRNTLLRSLEEGRIVIRTPDGAAYDGKGCVAGTPGTRRRYDQKLTALRLEDDVLVTVRSSDTAKEWLREDETKPPKHDETDVPPPPPPPPTPTQVPASTWEQIIEYAKERPLAALTLTARTPALAASLASLAQPLGADSVALSVTVEGDLKTGGTMSFAATDVGINHPAKPLQIAQTVFNSIKAATQYRADLELKFANGGRRGMEAALGDLASKAPEELAVRALFEKP